VSWTCHQHIFDEKLMSRLTTTATLSTELFLSYCACDMFATRSCDVMWPLYIMLTLWRCVRQLDSVSKKFPPLYYILKFDFLIFQGSVATCLRCGGYCRMGFVANFTCFPVMQKFWKSVQISQIYIEFKGGNFFETQCRSSVLMFCCFILVCICSLDTRASWR